MPTKKFYGDIDLNGNKIMSVGSTKATIDDNLFKVSPGDASGYIEPGGFQLANVTINDKTSVELETGGLITAKDLTTGDDVQQVIPDGLQAEADSATDLLKGTWQANSWYYLGLQIDSSGTNTAKLVYVQEGETIGEADLDTGYDSFVALSIPGAVGGWVLTDSDGGIYPGEWTTDGRFMPGPDTVEDFSALVSDSTPPETATNSVDISGQAPPVDVEIWLQRVYLATSGSITDVGLSSFDFTSNGGGETTIQNNRTLGIQYRIGLVQNQTMYYGYSLDNTRVNTFIIGSISSWRVV